MFDARKRIALVYGGVFAAAILAIFTGINLGFKDVRTETKTVTKVKVVLPQSYDGMVKQFGEGQNVDPKQIGSSAKKCGAWSNGPVTVIACK